MCVSHKGGNMYKLLRFSVVDAGWAEHALPQTAKACQTRMRCYNVVQCRCQEVQCA